MGISSQADWMPFYLMLNAGLLMIDKEAKKSLKKIQKEIKKLKKDLSKLELRPCQNDVQLKQKEQDLRELSDKLRELEKAQDRYILDSGRVKHSL
jgi:septal ring factor EnvC (AmiA/AmiB activator)